MTDDAIANSLRNQVRQGTITGWYQWTHSIRQGPRWTLAHPDRTTTTMDRDTITAHLSDPMPKFSGRAKRHKNIGKRGGTNPQSPNA